MLLYLVCEEKFSKTYLFDFQLSLGVKTKTKQSFDIREI